MPCKIYLRCDQDVCDVDDLEQYDKEKSKVVIFAPTWVKEKGLKLLGEWLKGISFEVHGRSSKIMERFTLSEDITLVQLQRISRAEARNTSGVIKFGAYEPDISDKGLVMGMRDLVRQCIIVGKDKTKHFGGYNSPVKSQKDPVYICDLAGLQFQRNYNSGRLVLVCENSKLANQGCFDELIFQEVVGTIQNTFQEIKLRHAEPEFQNRYTFCSDPTFGNCFFDSVAYKRFVQQDTYISAFALSKLAAEYKDEINFKFLKYGTGFFAGRFGSLLNNHILDGVIFGLEEVFTHHPEVQDTIKHIEFPFYYSSLPDKKYLCRLEEFKLKYNVNYKFSNDDALKTTVEGLVTATTNCGDPHVVIGNKMGHSSVDAAIASNLKSKGNIFCPNLNKNIQEQECKRSDQGPQQVQT